MIYTLDCEFYEHGHLYPVELISIGVADQSGRTFYGVNKDFDWQKVPYDHWLIDNVFPHLNTNPNTLKSRRQIKAELLNFIGADTAPEFWAYFADYDWVVFCQIFGSMIDLPPNFPQMCLDINQFRIQLGLDRSVKPIQASVEHNAINDAVWDMAYLKMLKAHERAQVARQGLGSI